MEEEARWHEAPPVPEHGQGLNSPNSPTIEIDLQARIRSLLASRNGHHPPRNPCPSPDFQYISQHPDKNLIGNYLAPARTYSFKPARINAELARSNSLELRMGAIRFDGPAGQFEDEDTERPRRPSQPEMQINRDSVSEDRGAPVVSGLDQKTRGDLLGRDLSNASSLSKAKLASSKQSSQTRIPRYSLRTVAPTPSQAVADQLRPSAQNAPGNYTSDIGVGETPKVTSPLAEEELAREHNLITAHTHLGPGAKPHSSAIEALHKAQNHEVFSQNPVDQIVRGKISKTTLRSNYSVKQTQHSLLTPLAGHSSVAQAAKPVLTTSLEHAHSHGEAGQASLFVIGDDDDARVMNESRSLATHAQRSTDQAQPEEAKSYHERISMANGPKAVDLLAQLSPINKSTADNLADHYLTARRASDGHNVSSNIHTPSAPSLHSLVLDVDDAVESMDAPLLPQATRSDLQSDVDTTPKMSPVSRAFSMLSEFSARSGQRVGNDSVARMDGRRPNDSSLSNVSGPPRLEEQDRHWIRQMLGKRSSTSVGAANLTARPHHRQRRALDDAARLRANEMRLNDGNTTLSASHVPKRPMDSGSNGDPAMLQHQQQNSESFTKVILDLESLLKEALTIAGRAASRENSEATAPPPRKQRQQYRRLPSKELLNSSDSQISFSGGLDEEDNFTTEPNPDPTVNSGHVVVVEPNSEAGYRGHFKKARDATPFPRSLAATRHQSTVPPFDDNGFEAEVAETLVADDVYSEKENFSSGPVHHLQPFDANDWALVRKLSLQPPPPPQMPAALQVPVKEQRNLLVRNHASSSGQVVGGDYADTHQRPPIQPRGSSMRMRGRAPRKEEPYLPDHLHSSGESESGGVPYHADFQTAGLNYHPVIREAMDGERSRGDAPGPKSFSKREDTIASLREFTPQRRELPRQDQGFGSKDYSLKDRHHFSIREPHGFSLSRSHRRAPIARDWSTSRKRYVATVTCISTALMGLIIGIYAGEVPAIQYTIADEHHYTILGNVLFFLGLAITTGLFYPLPLLHGRKPYTLAALVILLPLQFPQALAVDASRSPYVATYRVGLLVPRAFAGIVMGFANINFKTTLLDLFGASLQSGNPHQETVNENDVRRHGGGIGVWLGIWTWCAIGSIGVGFLIGAVIISGLDVSWGFWVTIILNAAVLLLNVLVPEVRRSAYRRSMAEVRNGGDVSRRIARGEIKMHLESTGPIWWWEEVIAGHVLSIRMLKQPGFVILSFYLGWIYGQVVMLIVLLGALLSKYYFFHPQYVGLSVAIIPLGALLAIPFQKASLFSRARHHSQRTDSMTFEKRVTWTSHLVRRAIFMIALPFAGLAYTLSSGGPPTNFMVPIIFAGLIGFLSNLAIAECNGLIMETFDTSDLQPGMTGRPRRILPEEMRKKRTNFSCFPRVTAGFAIAQTFAFLIAAGATAWGGVIERHVGAQTATAIVEGVLLIVTLMLIAVLTRFKVVQIIPSERFGTNVLSGPEDEWKPVIIGNPSGTTRRMSILELGTLTRWSEIRRRNKLGSQGG